jgi:hypothetical protein
VPFFQVNPFGLTQLSTLAVWADAPKVAQAIAMTANSDTTLFIFFMVFLLSEGAIKSAEIVRTAAGFVRQRAKTHQISNFLIVP